MYLKTNIDAECYKKIQITPDINPLSVNNRYMDLVFLPVYRIDILNFQVNNGYIRLISKSITQKFFGNY